MHFYYITFALHFRHISPLWLNIMRLWPEQYFLISPQLELSSWPLIYSVI